MSSASDDFKLPRTAIEEEMILDKKHAHELALAREKTLQNNANNNASIRRHRAEVWGWSVLGVTVTGLCLGLAYIIWQATAGPSDEDQRQQEQYRMCVVEKGGTWIPKDTDHGPICVADGKAETK